MILNDIEFGELLHLRAVNTRWQEVIESSFHSKQSLLLSNCKIDDDPFVNDLWLDLKNFINFKISESFRSSGKNTISLDACTLLSRLFPRNLKEFAIQVFVENDLNPNHLLGIFSKWSSLTTISFCGPTPKFQSPPELFDCLNSLTQLKQLSLNYYYPTDSQQLQPTLARLERFSARFIDYPDQDQFLLYLGPNCTHLAMVSDGNQDSETPEWITDNPRILSQLTHLKINLSESEELELICQQALSLQMLDVTFENSVRMI